jgi:hypothetical protein
LNTKSLKGEEKQNCLVVKITGSFQHALFFISKVLGSMRGPESDYSKIVGIFCIGVKLALALAFKWTINELIRKWTMTITYIF